MLKTIVLIAALICSCIYMVLFWVSNQIANKIQKPFVVVSALLLVLYLIL